MKKRETIKILCNSMCVCVVNSVKNSLKCIIYFEENKWTQSQCQF